MTGQKRIDKNEEDNRCRQEVVLAGREEQWLLSSSAAAKQNASFCLYFFFSCFTGRCFFFNSEEFALADRSGRTLCNAENLTFPSC